MCGPLLLLPLLLVTPVVLLTGAAVALGRSGPLGVVAAALLLGSVGAGTRWSVRAARRWWRSTAAR